MLYAALGGLVVIAGLSVALSVQSSRLKAVKAEYEAFQTQVRVVGEAQEARTKAEVKRQQEVTKNVEADYSKRLAKLRADYARLRDSNTSRGVLPAVPATARSPDAETRDQQLLGILQHAEEQTLRLIELQEWVMRQGRD